MFIYFFHHYHHQFSFLLLLLHEFHDQHCFLCLRSDLSEYYERAKMFKATTYAFFEQKRNHNYK